MFTETFYWTGGINYRSAANTDAAYILNTLAYTISNRTLQTVAVLPEGRYLPAGAARDNFFYLFGGLVGPVGSATASASVIRLDVTGATNWVWSPVAALAVARYGMGAAHAPVTGVTYIPTGCSGSASINNYPPSGFNGPTSTNEYRNATQQSGFQGHEFSQLCASAAAVLNGACEQACDHPIHVIDRLGRPCVRHRRLRAYHRSD